MSRNAVVSASKQFLKTREASAAAPSIRGFMRHIEANMRLYEAFVSNASGAWSRRFAFALWRTCLRLVCDLKSGVGRLLRWF